LFPKLGPRVGYAVTCVYGLPDPAYKRYSFLDVVEELDKMEKPTILLIQQKFPPVIAGKVGLVGGNMAATMKAVGCVGLISNGPSRDIDEIRDMEFQLLIGGITPGHGPMAVHAINVPVSIAGMDVAPGEIIHMDENGACKFTADRLEEVVHNVKLLHDEEAARFKALKSAHSASEVRRVYPRELYGKR